MIIIIIIIITNNNHHHHYNNNKLLLQINNGKTFRTFIWWQRERERERERDPKSIGVLGILSGSLKGVAFSVSMTPSQKGQGAG